MSTGAVEADNTLVTPRPRQPLGSAGNDDGRCDRAGLLLGLPLAVAFAQEGCEVIAVDVDARKVQAINAGESYIEDVPSQLLERSSEIGSRIHASTRYADLAKADAVLVCVPTPLTPNREPDLGPLVDSTRALADVLQAGQLVVLESTTYPALRASASCRCWRSQALQPGATFILPSRLSASIRAHRLHLAQYA